MNWLQSFFSTPARQALGWSALGIIGLSMATGGIWFLTEDDGGPAQVAQADDSATTPTSAARTTAPNTATATATVTATPTPSATATTAPSATATTRPAVSNPGTAGGGPASGGGQQSAPDPTATPIPDPTEPAVVAGGDYCPPSNIQGTLPSGRVAGAVTIAGAPAAAGTVDLFLAFDGVIGPSTKNVDGAFRLDFWAAGSDCANRVGASISVFANGQFVPTGRSIGDGAGQLIPVTVALP